MNEQHLLDNGWTNAFGGWLTPNKKTVEDFGVRCTESRYFDPPAYDFKDAVQIQTAIEQTNIELH